MIPDPSQAASSPPDADGLVLRPIAEDELRAFRRCLSTAYHLDLDWPDGARRRALRILELDRTLAAFDGGELVGTATALSFELSIPGGALPCAGVTWVSVLPTHVRRGIFARMMTELIAEARRREEPLAALWASEAGIYGRFGFGWADSRLRLSVDTRDLVPPRPPESGVPWRIRFAELDGAAALLAPIHAAVSARRGGLTSRSQAWWEERVLDDQPDTRGGTSSKRLVLALDGDGVARGYAIYRVSGIRPVLGTGHPPPGTIEVIELIADADEAAAALWRWLVGIDLIEHVDCLTRPVDDALPLLFDDPRRVTLVERSDSLWLRLVDVPRALQARSWACAASVVLRVHDERLAENDAIWRLTAAPGEPARCERTSAAPELELDVSELGAVYLGGTPVSQLVAAGRVAEHAPGAAGRLDAALRVDRAPWSIDRF